MTCYCVVNITTGLCVYSGTSLQGAAEALVRGTCFGKAETERQALVKALLEAERLKKLKASSER